MDAATEQIREEKATGVRLSALAGALALSCLAAPAHDPEVSVGFASDIPSDVLAGAPRGCVLVTSHGSLNVVAVAAHTGIAGIIVTSGREPSDEVLRQARRQGVGLYLSADQSFDVAGRLAALGLHGPNGNAGGRS